MNRTFMLTIELCDDLVLSERSATTGGHYTLDYIPGSTLLGAMARQLYQDKRVDPWLLFHSSQVRFGCGYPLTAEGEQTYPVPRCLYRGKSADSSMPAVNLAVLSQQEAQNELNLLQLVQMRSGYVTVDRQNIYSVVHPRKSRRLKTAINDQTGTVADGQLFGYESIQAGQLYGAELSLSDEVPQDIQEILLEHLSGVHYLGRSRSAQYGKVRIQVKPGCRRESIPLEQGQDVVLYLCSDLAFVHSPMSGSLVPDLAETGFSGACYVPEKSYVQQRIYAPWNAWRRSYDLDRQVLTAGSVLVYRGLDVQQSAQLIEKMRHGIGLYRECGLGQVWINPPFLRSPTLKLDRVDGFSQATSPKKPNTPLVNWLTRRGHPHGELDQTHQRVKDLVKELQTLYCSCHVLLGYNKAKSVGPGNSQWGRIVEVARSGQSSESLLKKLFGIEAKTPVLDRQKFATHLHHKQLEDIVCKQGSDEDWGQEGMLGKERMMFSYWLYKRFFVDADTHDPSLLLRLLAKEAVSQSMQKSRRGEETT